MPVTSGNPITQADLDALAQLANDKLLPIVNRAITANENGWGDQGWAFFGGNGQIASWAGLNIYDIPSSNANGTQLIKKPQPEYKFDIATKNWADELNRIRGDFMALFFNSFADAGAVYRNLDFLLSGPWVVGLNDPDTFPMTQWTYNFSKSCYDPTYYKNLIGSHTLDGTGEFIAFKNVKFYYSDADAPAGVTISTGRFSKWTAGTSVPTLTYDAALAGAWNVKIAWQFRWIGGGTPPAAPSVSGFAFTVTGGATITWTTEKDLFNNAATKPDVVGGGPVGTNYYILRGEFTLAISGSGSVGITATTVPTGFEMLTAQGNSFLEFSSSSTATDANGVHPLGAAKSVSGDAHPANSNFTLNGELAKAAWQISPDVKGIWVANTLPVPGQNVFLDQDIPPFVGIKGIYWTPGGEVATSASGMIGINVPVASSMRESAPGQKDYTNNQITSRIKDFALLKSSLEARPTPYLVLRDTDFVPFSYGFNFNTVVKYLNLLAPADGSLWYNDASVPANATAVIVRAVKAGTGRKGWKNCILQYGDPLDTPLNIYVKKTSQPTISDYDFKKTDSSVTIDPDGGGSYLATILGADLLYGIENTSGADMRFDLVFEIDNFEPQVRQFFPDCNECFSYAINDGATRIQYGVDGYFRNKPVPQNGYCIFKLRATRLPVTNSAGKSVTPSSGSEIVVTIGQNKLQLDNTLVFTPMLKDDGITPFTVTIPAIDRDSGDVAVFWPVLSGNEIVYQCSVQVIMDAWVNWQPIFFNSVFAGGPDPYNLGGGLQVAPDALAFHYALGFTNYFNKTHANYPNDSKPIIVQFPISAEIYNDLWECLGGMSYPGPAGGAGGTGGSGGGGGAGGAGGGGGF